MSEDYIDHDRRQTVVPAPNNLQYVVAVVAMAAIGAIAVVALTALRPATDNTALIAVIVGLVAPTTLSLLAFMKSQETHLSVNSRLDAFISNAKLASHAQGITEGRAQGRDSANQRTDALAAAAPQLQQPVVVASRSGIPQVEAPVTVIAPRER